MSNYVLKERLKELIGDRRVTAALFYTFNFDAEFFENYVLPIFLPEVSFGDNKIQNSILWRKYQQELPPVCVYCDFHAKKPEAPALNYAVRLIDLPRSDNYKPCFHPKLTYVLLDDNSLITLVGSNNLTTAGWCSNLEGIVEIVFRNGKYFPQTFKDQFRKLFSTVKQLDPEPERELTEAEALVNKYFYKKKYTEEVGNRLFNSTHQSFLSFLKEVKRDFNRDRPFKKVEVISPYYSPCTKRIQKIKTTLGVEELLLSIPFENTGVIGMEEGLFVDYEEEGVQWSRIILQEKEKAYRFNHSKVYRLLGDEQMLTIIGSVNCTKAATSGAKSGGNVETAVLLIDDARNWQGGLRPIDTTGYRFSGNASEEGTDRDRKDVPAIEFILDWAKRQLLYRWLKNPDTGQVELSGSKYPTNDPEGVISLKSAEMLQGLADNAIIRFHYKRQHFDFFPIQKGIEARPISTKLLLSDKQILQLWSAFDEEQVQSEDLEKIVEQLTRESDGEFIEIETNETESTMNLMAAHLHGLVQLERKLFKAKLSKKEERYLQKRRDYYLYTDNIDTLIGYYKLLIDLNSKAIITDGFFWLLLELIKTNFYGQGNINSRNEFYSRHQDIVAQLNTQQGKLRKKMASNGVSRAHLNWTKKMLVS